MQKADLSTLSPEQKIARVFVEPTLDEIDRLDPAAPLSRNTPRDNAKAANQLMAALMPTANRQVRRAALLRLKRSKKVAK